jgi:hypothetical protein
MPQTITVAAFVFGAVLLLIALLGGRFKIFGAEVSEAVGRTGRIVAAVAGIVFICIGLYGSFPDKGSQGGSAKKELPAPPPVAKTTPAPVPPPSIVSFASSKPKITRGEAVFLNWNVNGADTVTLNGEAVDSYGSKKVNPQVTTKYVLIARNRDGSSSEESIVFVEEPASPPVPPPRIVSFRPSKTQVTSGDTVIISWEVTQADQVLLNGQTVSSSGSREYRPTTTTPYRLEARNKGGTNQEAFTVTVISPPKPSALIGYLVVLKNSNINQIKDLKSGEKICCSPSGRDLLLRSFPSMSTYDLALVSSAEIYQAMITGMCKAAFFQQRESADKLFPAIGVAIRLLPVYD